MTPAHRTMLACAVLAMAGCAKRRPGATPPAPSPPAPVAPGAPITTDTAARPATPVASLPLPPSDTAARRPARREDARRCVLDFENTGETRMQLLEVDTVSRKRVTFLGGGLRGRCRGQEITIVADSAESYEQNDLYLLIGNVHYREPKAAIDAQRVTYHRREERLVFEVDVRAETRNGDAVMVGPRLEYFRPVEGIRQRARMVATDRPQLTHVERDSLGRSRPPSTMVAQRIIAEGDSNYYAAGQVEITRGDLFARGDSAEVTVPERRSRLLRKPVIEGKGTRPFTLHGRAIDLFGTERDVDRIVALDSARAVSKDLTLVSDTLDLRVASNRLERAFAFGRSGAVATTRDRTVIADSLDIIMPGQRLRELHAVGKAYVESDPDSLRIQSDERDWLRGDTVIAVFDSLPAGDTTATPAMRTVVASGEASALYQMAPATRAPSSPPDSAARVTPPATPPAAASPAVPGANPAASPSAPRKPAINYVRGRRIHLAFARGQVETVTVEGQTSGVYLEPESDSTAATRRRTTRPPTRPPPTVVPPIRRPPAPFP